jgi:hypothetical protein
MYVLRLRAVIGAVDGCFSKGRFRVNRTFKVVVARKKAAITAGNLMQALGDLNSLLTQRPQIEK